MNKTSQPKIDVQNLNLFYHGHQALFQVNLSIFAGQVLSLIGPSGCGKSTFLRCLNRMNDKAEGVAIFGQVLIDGDNIYGPGVDVVQLRARVGMVFQKPNPFPKSIYDNVAYGPRIHGLAKTQDELDEIVISSLKKTGLLSEVEHRLDALATSLSGGQQQRLCIARAIAVNPEVILMDEPTSALDPIATARIEELIDELRGRFTLVIVTHNLQQAARISQQVAFFSDGHLVEAADTALIFTNPQDERTQAYLTGRSIATKGASK